MNNVSIGEQCTDSMDIDLGVEDEGVDEDNLTFEQQVDEALSRLPEVAQEMDVRCEVGTTDEVETDTVREFMNTGCGCQRYNGQECSLQFTIQYVLEVRSWCLE